MQLEQERDRAETRTASYWEFRTREKRKEKKKKEDELNNRSWNDYLKNKVASNKIVLFDVKAE